MRSINSAAGTLLASGCFGLAQLIEMQLTSTVRLSTTGPNLTWGGYTWAGAAGIGSVDAVEQQAAEIKSLRFVLNGVPDANVAIAMGEPLQNRPVIIRTCIFDPATWAVADVITEEVGYMDTMALHEDAITEPGQAVATSITATAEGAAIDLLRPRGLLYTHAHQQRLHPTDNGMQYVRDADLDITWPAASFFTK
jgi:hypothetical protein